MDSDGSSGEDIFECGRCGKRFVDYGLFKAHKKDRVCKWREDKTNESGKRLDLVSGGSLEKNLTNISMELQCQDVPLYNRDQLDTGTNSNNVELPAELTSITDIGHDPSKLTTRNKSQLIDHDYNIFLQTQIDSETDTQTDRNTEICMLCSVVTTNLHDHLINQHMIAKDKIVEFVSLYSEDVSCKSLNKPDDKKTENTCTRCHTVFKTSLGLQKHVCKNLISDNSNTKNETKHTGSENTCQECDGSFTNFDSFMNHVCSKLIRAFCTKCKFQFLNSSHMQNHKCSDLVRETKNCTTRTRRCSLCEFSSVHSAKLLSHFREQHMDGDYIDENVTGTNSDADEENQKRSSGNERVKCNRCKHSFLENNLEKHRLICNSGKGRTCILCNHYARDTHDYTVHVDTHKVWLDLENIKKTKETEQGEFGAAEDQSVFEDTDRNPKQMDCSKLRLTDLDKLTNKISKEQHLVNSEDEKGILATSQNEDVGTSHDKKRKYEDASQRSHRNIMTRKCKSCGKYLAANSLNHHMLATHNKIKLFRCFLESCAKVYIGIEQFNEHAKSHPENEDMLWCGCKTCVQFHPSGINKRKELRKKTMRQYYQKMMYKCEKCWCKFPTEAGLSKHKTNESHSYPCHVCGKILVSVRQLKIHILTHDSSRPYLCDVCGLGYKTSRDLKKHRLNHSDVRPFVCETCGKAFTTKLKLNRHNLCVHNPVKRFECTHDGCERKFSRKDKLKDHLNTHLEVEPFKCPYCNKGFSRSDNLRDHEVLHTRDYRFKCDMCSKGYMRPKLLEVHKQREHADQETDKQNKQDTFPLYALYSNQPIQILPESIQTLTSDTVQQLQQVVNISEQQEQAALDAQYQQALVNTAVPNITVFDSL